MSDYTIVGLSSVRRVLELVQPFVVFKREQVDRALDILSRLETMQSPEAFLASAKLVDAFATLNYSKRKVINAECVQAYLSGKGLLVPVTTEASSKTPRSQAATEQGKSSAAITRQLLERG